MADVNPSDMNDPNYSSACRELPFVAIGGFEIRYVSVDEKNNAAFPPTTDSVGEATDT